MDAAEPAHKQGATSPESEPAVAPQEERNLRESEVGIVGAGALARLFAALLVAGGQRATLLTRRTAAVEQIRSEGVLVRDESVNGGGAFRAHPNVVPAHEGVGPFDVVLLLNKSYDAEWAAGLGSRVVADGGVVISLQNGLRTAPIVEAAERGVTGTTYQGAGFDANGTVVWSISGPTYAAPRESLRADTERLVTRITSPRCPFAVVPDRDVMVWTKLVSAISNSVSGALFMPVTQVLQSDHVWEILEEARREAFEVATRLGVGLDRVAMEQTMASRPKSASRGTTGSTFQSLASGRLTEVADISGAIAELAQKLGQRAPYNEVLHLLVAAREEMASGGGWQSRDPDRGGAGR